MDTQQIKALVAAKIAGQGSAVDAGSALPAILDAICDVIDGLSPAEETILDVYFPLDLEEGGFPYNPNIRSYASLAAAATALHLTEDEAKDLFDGKPDFVKVRFYGQGDEDTFDSTIAFGKFRGANPAQFASPETQYVMADWGNYDGKSPDWYCVRFYEQGGAYKAEFTFAISLW